MRKPVLVLLLASVALPACAAKRVTVEQLEQLLAADRGKPDAKIAQQLANLEITERLSTARLSRWEAALRGPESRRSLLILADLSAFLAPPAAEIPATAIPDLATQRKIMATVASATTKTISKLPDFFATRDTVFFKDTPPSRRMGTSLIPYERLHPVSRSSDTVLYRDGREEVNPGVEKNKESTAHGLTTSGIFGPILGTVLVDAAQGNLAWSHWEQGEAGPIAVFQFAVTREKSHYEVSFCCVVGESGEEVFRRFAGYHGEIAVDAENGAVLRLTLKADMTAADPLVRSDIMVEYGPVAIGGKTYICPLKSVSISLAPTLPANAFEMQRYRGELLDKDRNLDREHLQTLLNDVAFEQYHVFRVEARILSGDRTQDSPSISSIAPETKDSSSTAPSATVEVGKPSASASAAPAEMAASVSAPASMPENSEPEIQVGKSTSLPDPDLTSVGTRGAGFTIRVISRLVDVGVVAFDKKGHPVTGLAQDNFEVYDNGRKQNVRFFSRSGEESRPEVDDAPDQPARPPVQVLYSNRPADKAHEEGGSGAIGGSITILLIDVGHIAWTDLTYARDQMLKFLQKLPPGERVGLYVQNAQDFQVLVEATEDHALLASTLRRWMPGAQDLARAQEMELRNRQQFDYVLNPADLQSVNGNINVAPDTATGVDPNLRNNGSNPELSAMSVLVGIARHLAAFPGHKNLVWVAGDNVLANWSDKAVGGDKGSKTIDSLAHRAQEALNDAQVSLFPLDASQLDTMAVDPSLKDANVDLSPSVTAPPPSQSGGQGPGRITAEMQQNIHSIQGFIQQLAEATGGRIIRRSGNIAANLNAVVADGHAVYLLGFSPDTPADNQYHQLTVKVVGRRGMMLRYRTGYEYAREPATLKERFHEAVWQSLDQSEIGVSAKIGVSSEGSVLKLSIATKDLAIKQQDERWTDKLDIFLAQRDDEGLNARITGQTLHLTLKSATYAKLMREGLPFDQFIEKVQESGSIRVIVVDGNSGNMGSVTVPVASLRAKN
jgi:VWFA-related protein